MILFYFDMLKFCENSHDLFPDVKRQISRDIFIRVHFMDTVVAITNDETVKTYSNG